MISTCPPDGELSSLLSGNWSGDSIEDLESHLSECISCRDRLETLSNSSKLANWLSDDSIRYSQYPYLTRSDRPGDLGRIGRFFVESEIGRGGMGLVFQAWDSDLQRTVALKVLRIGKDDQAAANRFAREARAAGKVQHDHLVPVLDVTETDDGRPVIVMPRIVGQSLREILRRQTTLPARQAATIIRQIADGLHAIHSAGLIHRDIKPANILLDDSDGRVKLTDFGLSRSVHEGETLTQDGTIVGTPEYLSPEQTTDATKADSRSDLYSLGATFYECLTGMPPFRGSPIDVITKHRQDEPVSLRTLNSSIPADLETITLKLLSKRPEQRYASASELRNELDHWLNGRPILARPAGLPERMGKWCRRNPWPVAFSVAIFLGLVVSLFGWRQAYLESGISKARENDAKTSESKAQENRKLADERSLLALGAINTLISKSQNLIGDAPGTLALKKQLNEFALADLRKLSSAVSAVPGVDRSTVSAQLQLGDTFNLLGQSDEAMKQWQFALVGVEKLMSESPNDPEIIRDFARVHYVIGFTQNRLSQVVPAAEHFDVSIKHLESARAANPTNIIIRENLALAYQGRGDVWWTIYSAKNANNCFETAAEIDRQLVAESPNDSELKSRLLYITGRIGYIQIVLLHDYSKAERGFREQLAIAKSQFDANPNDPKWQRNYRITSLDLSASLQRQGKFAEAEELAQSVLKPLAETAKANPDNAISQRDHSSAWTHLGHIQIASGRFAEAEFSFHQSRAILEAVASRSNRVAIVSQDMSSMYLCLSGVCERQGKFKEAASWVAKIITATEAHFAGNQIQLQYVVSQVKKVQDALLLMPEFLNNPKLPEGMPEQTVVSAIFFRTTHQARSGKIEDARKDIQLALLNHPNNSTLLQAQAIIEGIAAEHAKSDQQRTSCLNAGSNYLLAAIRNDRSILDTINLAPECVKMRQLPEFQKGLAEIINAK